MVEHLSDDQLARMRLGGHDPIKVHAAYRAAFDHTGAPTIILAKTIKGYGLGEAGEGKNITHQQKKLNEDELEMFRSRFGIPIPDDELHEAPFYRPADDSAEIKYMQARRQQLGGYMPQRKMRATPLKPFPDSHFEEFHKGTEGREVSTTMVFVRLLAKLLRDPELGKSSCRSFPTKPARSAWKRCSGRSEFIPASARTTSPSTWTRCSITRKPRTGRFWKKASPKRARCVRSSPLVRAYANHGINTIPFFIYYSMFGFQRIGDLIWAAADMRCRGFLIGGTAGRTTLAGEGLQHQDGHSHVLALPVPNLLAYDPAFAYEIAIIIQDGIKRMYIDQESIFYYLTVTNEPLADARDAAEGNIREGVLKGLYRFKASAQE